jgi:hypothetical protein
MNEVLRWMIQEDDRGHGQRSSNLKEAELDPEAVAYFMEVIPEDIMRATVKRYAKRTDPQDVVRIALAATFVIGMEAGSRCRKINIERGGD